MGEMFEAKRQARLLDDLPQHRLATGRETLLQPVAARHEIIDGDAGTVCLTDRHRMDDRTGTGRPFVVRESALVGVDVVAQPKIIQIADYASAGAGSEELYRACGKTALDQVKMKRLEKRAGEGVRLAPPRP